MLSCLNDLLFDEDYWFPIWVPITSKLRFVHLVNIQDVPIHIGIIGIGIIVFVPSLLFLNRNFIVKHLKTKTASLGISKMWSTIFPPSNFIEILGNLSRFQFIKNHKTV